MRIPSQSQLLLPLLESLQEMGGTGRPQAIYDRIQEKLSLPDSVVNSVSDRADRGKIRLFDRAARWTYQTAKLKRLVASSARGIWELTEQGKSKLPNIRRGVVVTVFHTPMGVYLCANAEDAVAYIDRGSVDLLLTSPPYPLLRPRAYGNPDHIQWVDWMLALCEKWLPLMTADGSMMFNLGPCWKPGLPAQSTYAERFLIKMEDRLGMHLIQRLDWHSPSKPTGPMPWTSKQRSRITSSVEPIFWVSQNPNCHGNNRNVLQPYTAGGLRAIREASKGHRLKRRPSGWKFGTSSHVDNGGAIPKTWISAAPNGKVEQDLRKAEEAAGLYGDAKHPALMPAAVAQFCIGLATERLDTVYDPFGGSGTVAVEAEKLGRYAIHSERAVPYFQTARMRAELASLAIREGNRIT